LFMTRDLLEAGNGPSCCGAMPLMQGGVRLCRKRAQGNMLYGR
jgi:hypothetical protein